MTKIVGIRFRAAGKIYYFDPVDFELDMAMHVIVETARGIEMGTVLIPPRDVEDEKVVQPLKPVIRIATEEDENTAIQNKEKEKEAFAICKEKILKHELNMKLVDAEYTFDSNKLLFYFTADGRIDFRELVKDLASVFRTRIELRQIGVRDETKMMGGIGICGRPLCCSTYMPDFVPVSIKMAKEQNLSLNPTKISGVCGRLMCCLKYEQDTYEYLNSRLPSVGEKIKTPDGLPGEVKSVSVLRQLVRVVIDNGEEKELREYTVDELRLKPRQRKDIKLTEEELRELQGLEDTDENAEEKSQKTRSNSGYANAQDSQEVEHEQSNESSGYRNYRNGRASQNSRGYRGGRNNQDERGYRGDRENQDEKGYRGSRGNQDERGYRGSRDNQDERSYRDSRDNQDERGYRGDRENQDEKGYRGKSNQDNREYRDSSEKKYTKNYKSKNNKYNKLNKQKYNRSKENKNKHYNRDYNQESDNGYSRRNRDDSE